MSVVATVDPYTSAKDIPHAEVGAGLFYLYIYIYISVYIYKLCFTSVSFQALPPPSPSSLPRVKFHGSCFLNFPLNSLTTPLEPWRLPNGPTDFRYNF